MKKILLSIAALSLALGASAATKRLVSVLEKSQYSEDFKVEISYDASGRMYKLSNIYGVSTIDYSQLASKKLILTEEDTEYGESYRYEMTLNEEGLVVKAVEYYNGVADDDYRTFEYADGRLVSSKQISEDETEEDNISYNADGSVAKVEHIDGSETECETITFEYDNIANTGNLAYWDMLFDVDLDEYEFIAMAGFMGKAPAQLPVKSVYTDFYGSGETTFTWVVDADSYPASLAVSSDGYTENYEFGWEAEGSGVSTVSAECDASRYYTIDGLEVKGDAKGLVIERKADGRILRRLNK